MEFSVEISVEEINNLSLFIRIEKIKQKKMKNKNSIAKINEIENEV